MIKHPDLTALTPVVSTAPPPLPSDAAAQPSFNPDALPTATYALVPESPFGSGHHVAGQQAAALASLFAAAQALQAAAAELTFWENTEPRTPNAETQDPAGGRILHPSFSILYSSQSPLAHSIGSLVGTFSSLRTCLLDSSLSLSSRLVHDIFAVTHDRTAELAMVGITLAADGALVIDQAALQRAAQTAPELLESMFAGPKGLAAQLRRLASEVGVSVQNIFAAMTPTTPGLATLPSRLAQLFGQALVAG